MRYAAVLAAVPFICALASAPDAARADQSAIDARTACATAFAATKVDRDPNSVVVRVTDPAAPLAGTITAYGRDRRWTGTIGRSVSVDTGGQHEDSLVVRADAPIEAVEFAPSWAGCTFRAAVRARNGYDARDVERPVLVLGDPQPVAPADCARPYASATVKRAFEPVGPNEHVHGMVWVAVSLDEQGRPQAMRIVSSPASALNTVSLDAARRSEYSGAVFRCKPVPSGYEFAIDYP